MKDVDRINVVSMPPIAYFDAMFSNEPLGGIGIFTAADELAAACHHEASHAVANYVFGKSLQSVGVKASYYTSHLGEATVGYGGLVQTKNHGRPTIRIDYPYRRSHFIMGCVSAAGPAGERRLRYERKMPMRLLGACEGDHRAISTIGKALQRRGRCRFAYERLVWKHAQRLVANSNIWAAISDVGDELYNEAAIELDINSPGESWAFISPNDVNFICRRNGLKQGMALAA